MQHFLGKIDGAVTGGFGTNQRSAPFKAFAGQDAGELVAQSLILAKQKADFASADADVAGRNIRVRADMAEQFGHEALAEPHDFVIGFAFGIEIRAAFAAAHRQSGQGVLKNLLKSQELQNPG